MAQRETGDVGQGRRPFFSILAPGGHYSAQPRGRDTVGRLEAKREGSRRSTASTLAVSSSVPFLDRLTSLVRLWIMFDQFDQVMDPRL